MSTYGSHRFQRVVIWIQTHSVKKNPENRITLCKINNVKKEKYNGYIINVYLGNNYVISGGPGIVMQ